MALQYDGGVVLAADSRTSCGPYVSNRVSDKLTRISDKIYCCRSGSVRDTQDLSESVSNTMYTLQMTLGEQRVSDAANEMRNLMYAGRDHLLASIIVAGWDRREGGQVYSVQMGGLLVKEPCATAGSGSTYIMGFLSDQYRPGMKKTQAVNVAKKAVQLAIHHDCCSGGVVRVGVIDKNGMGSRSICHYDPEVAKFANKFLWKLELDKLN